MLIEEIPPKIYRWQKRNKSNNKHSFTKTSQERRGAGGPYGVFYVGGRGWVDRIRSYATSCMAGPKQPAAVEWGDRLRQLYNSELTPNKRAAQTEYRLKASQIPPHTFQPPVGPRQCTHSQQRAAGLDANTLVHYITGMAKRYQCGLQERGGRAQFYAKYSSF